MKKIFAYGTLLDPVVQMEVLGRTETGTFAVVDGYRVLYDYEVNGVEYPIAIKDSTSKVLGKFFDITDEDLSLIDEYETNDYIRKIVKTTEGIEAHMYVKPYEYERFYTE